MEVAVLAPAFGAADVVGFWVLLGVYVTIFILLVRFVTARGRLSCAFMGMHMDNSHGGK